MTLDEAIKYEKESLQHCKRMLEEIYEDNLENKILKFEVKQHEQLAQWLEDYKHIKQWKSDIMDNFCKYDVSSFEELVANARNKAIDDYMNKLCNHCMQQTNECYKLECPFCTDGCDIVNIAEQLKSTCNKEKCTYTIRKPIEYFDYDAWLQSEAE